MNKLLQIILIIIFIKFQTEENTKVHARRSYILNKQFPDFCMMSCSKDTNKTLPHTLCPRNQFYNGSEKCSDDYVEYNVEQHFRKQILFAHNGIRNRIAQKVNAANMRIMRWSRELSEMACKWLRKCEPYKYDPCTQIQPNLNKNFTWTRIKQNIFHIRSTFLPPDIIPLVMRNWYRERDNMSQPLIKGEFGFVTKFSNYTQLIGAGVQYVGCALVGFKKGYAFACNYLAYDCTVEPAFRYGKPTSECPNEAPVMDKQFINLCTGFFPRNQAVIDNLSFSILYFILLMDTIQLLMILI